MIKLDQTQTKFVVISHGRTGTACLRSMLNSHPEIYSFSEQFGLGRVWHSPKDVYSKSGYKSIEDYLKNYIFLFKKNKKAVGFNLMYNNYFNINFDFKNFILKNKIKTIHLIRSNLLDTAISYFLANLNDCWFKDTYKKNTCFDSNLYENFFINYEKKINLIKNDFNSLEIFYEKLFEKETNDQILDYLNVKKIKLITDTKKQRQDKKQSDLVMNYYDLKKYFQGTRYEKYFLE